MRSHSLLIACAFLIVGVPFWVKPYFGLNLPDGLLHPGLIAVPLTAAWLRLRGGWGSARSLWVTTAIAPAVVMARVTVETSVDPTSHNLWPFELVIAGLLGLVVAAVGVAIAAMLRRAKR
jgi:hypothetical protein